MPQNRVEDLLVYQKAVAALESVVALIDGPAFDRDPKLRQQIRTASGRITTHLQEGSGQAADRHYAHYVAIARGSSKETKGHLHRALACGFITDAEFKQHWQLFDEIAAMLTGLKRYLEREDGRRNCRLPLPTDSGHAARRTSFSTCPSRM